MFSEDEYENMRQLESVHWWYKALHHQVTDVLQKAGIKSGDTIIDAACGTGGLMVYLREKGFNQITGFDISPTAVAFATERGLTVKQGDLKDMLKLYSQGSADVVICNDALYFLSETEQQALLRDLHFLLKPGGLFLANLPALKMFSGNHDRHVGIHTRFTPKGVRTLIGLSSFRIQTLRFWPFLLSGGIGLWRAGQRIRMKLFPRTIITSDLQEVNGFLNRILYQITLLEQQWMTWKPFGSSLFMVLINKKINDKAA